MSNILQVVQIEEVERRFLIASFAMQIGTPDFMKLIEMVEANVRHADTMSQTISGKPLCRGLHNRWAALRDAMLAASEFCSAMRRYEEVMEAPCPDHGERHDR